MNDVTFYEYIRQTEPEIREIVTACIGIFLLLFTMWAYRDVLLRIRYQGALTYNALFGPLGGLLLSALCFLMVYWGAQRRYLLRKGAYRYTVAHVTEHGMRRGYRRFVYRYAVAGEEHQGTEDCGVSRNRELPCPPLGTRYYVQFAPEDPATDQITQLEVPDSVQVVPPLGWAQLP